MSALNGFSSRKSQFPPGEAQRRISVTKEGTALGLINWMALAIPFGARDTRLINKVSIRVVRALTLGAERDRNQPVLCIAIYSSLCSINTVESPQSCVTLMNWTRQKLHSLRKAVKYKEISTQKTSEDWKLF